MKPFYATDLTQDKNNDTLNGDIFLTAKPSATQVQQFESSHEEFTAAVEAGTMPRPLRYLRLITLCFGAMATVPLFSNVLFGDVTLAEQLRIAPFLVVAGPLCLIVGLILLFIERKKSKAVAEKTTTQEIAATLDATTDRIFEELGVPADAKTVDILTFFYKEKDGEIKVCEKPMQLFSHIANPFYLFGDTENVYLVNLEGKYAFPRSCLQNVIQVDKKVRITNWTKKQSPNEGEYKAYKMTTDQFGCVHAKPHYILQFYHNGEQWGIYFPCYELNTFEDVTGLKAQ